MDKTCSQREIGVLLHAWELDILTETDRERFELHLLHCDFCADEVAQIQAEMIMLKDDPSVLSDAGRARSAEDLSRRGTRFWRYLWPEHKPMWARPVVAYLAVLLLAYPAYLGVRDNGEGTVRHVQSVTLVPVRSPIAVSVVCPADQDLSVTYIYDASRAGDHYRVTLVSAAGDTIHSASNQSTGDHHVGHLLVPHRYVRPGTWSLVIEPDEQSEPGGRQEYEFEIVR